MQPAGYSPLTCMKEHHMHVCDVLHAPTLLLLLLLFELRMNQPNTNVDRNMQGCLSLQSTKKFELALKTALYYYYSSYIQMVFATADSIVIFW